MRAAPPAAWPVAHGGLGLWRLVHLGLPSTAFAALGWAVSPWPLQTAVLVALASMGIADRLWCRRTPSILVWNGVQWSLGSRCGGEVSLQWDGGRWLLACWRESASGNGTRRWLMLDRADAASAADWHALRVALVQCAGTARRAPAVSRAEAT